MPSLVENVRWYLKRLSVMHPSELVHRVVEQIQLKKMQVVYRLRGGCAPEYATEWGRLSFCTSSGLQLPELPWEYSCSAQQISSRLAGMVGALCFDWRWEDVAGVWHKAPDTGKRWPKKFFGVIPCRAGNPYGDIRVAWEPSRLQHLVELGLIANQVGGKQAIQAAALLEQQFLSWCSDNPPWCGIHYISAMECSLRIIAVVYALDSIRRYLRDVNSVWRECTRLIASHANLIEKRLSLHSSTGNHTIAECAGLVYAGVLFPEMDGAARWLGRGLSILCMETDHQILPDGGGIEQALWYQVFVVDLYGLVSTLLVSRDRNVPKQIEDALRRGREYISGFGTGPDDIPLIGDSDSGYALSRFLRLSWTNAPERDAGLTTYPDTGYSVVRESAAGGLELVLDHGALGMPPSFGHGHADALSLIVRIAGKTFLTDPGTYSYTGDPAWRNYFRSTRAHNTVCIDGSDQAKQETVFQWSRPFQSELVDAVPGSGGKTRLLARHFGYGHLGISHWRCVIVEASGIIWIGDWLEGAGLHDLELNWHVDATIDCCDEGYSAHLPSGRWMLGMRGGDSTLARAMYRPMKGWKSIEYGCKQPIDTVTCRFQGALPHGFTTVIAPADKFSQSLFEHFSQPDVRTWLR